MEEAYIFKAGLQILPAHPKNPMESSCIFSQRLCMAGSLNCNATNEEKMQSEINGYRITNRKNK